MSSYEWRFNLSFPWVSWVSVLFFRIAGGLYRPLIFILKAHSYSMSGGSIWASLECQCCFWIAGWYSHIESYDTNPSAIQKQQWQSREAQIEPPLFECEWAFRIQTLVSYTFNTMWLLTLQLFKNSIDIQGKLRLNLHSLSGSEHFSRIQALFSQLFWWQNFGVDKITLGIYRVAS
jgi:hypothetical protein